MALILEGDVVDKSLDLIATTVTRKVTAALTDVLAGLTASQTFLEASATQQANTILDLKDIATRCKSNTNNLSDITTKLSTLSTPLPSDPVTWPSLTSHRPSQSSLPPNTFNPTLPTPTTRLRQAFYYQLEPY